MQQSMMPSIFATAALVLLPLILSGCGGGGGDGPDVGAEAPGTMSTSASATPTISQTSFLSSSGTTPQPSTTAYSPPTTPPRSRNRDATFLIQATFGPTAQSLSELVDSSDYSAWIKAQMDLPMGLHREYYRSRVNPRKLAANTAAQKAAATLPPCGVGALWHRFAFTTADVGMSVFSDGVEVRVNGSVRTHIAEGMNDITAPSQCTNIAPSWGGDCEQEWSPRWQCAWAHSYWRENAYCQTTCWNAGYGFPGLDCSVGWPSLTFSGYICKVEEKVGGVVLLDSREDCSGGGDGKYDFTAMQNPAIYIKDSALYTAADASNFQSSDFSSDTLVLSTAPVTCDHGEFVAIGESFYRHFLRYSLVENTLQMPVGGGVTNADDETMACVGAPKTFVNEASCQMRANKCDSRMAEMTVVLDDDTLRKIHFASGRYLYYVSGLRAEASPCGTLSRWQQLDCSSENCDVSALSSSDESIISTALGGYEGWGWIRDVTAFCNAGSVPAGAKVRANGYVFQHIHLHEYNVYDFSEWVALHPGGESAITQWATQGFGLRYPEQHGMDRWHRSDAQASLLLVGVVWSWMRYAELPTELQTSNVALSLFGTSIAAPYAWTCGSPGESGSKTEVGHQFSMFLATDDGWESVDTNLDTPYFEHTPSIEYSKTTVWTMMALYGKDQLRQRMSWALSQIFVVGIPNFGFGSWNEAFVTYYDIFVRNAFGNFRDVLREVTFSPLMGRYLSFVQSWSLDFDGNYPDENYAREIMQLFTIGLWKLNPDGTRQLDQQGEPIPTYGNAEIMDFARVFTGFDFRPLRTNIEAPILGDNRNMIDPMQMRSSRHDVYPKMDLNGGYLGDGYPLCQDFPDDAFLAAGAVYELEGMGAIAAADVLNLTVSSPLFAELCGSPTPPCSFRNRVTLPAALACVGAECSVSARSVQLVQVDLAFYRFVVPTCVNLFFFPEGMDAVTQGRAHWWNWGTSCLNPALPVAGASCCSGCGNVPSDHMADQGLTCETADANYFQWVCSTNEWWILNDWCAKRCWEQGYGYSGRNCSEGDYRELRGCSFPRERLSFKDAEAKCAAAGMQICWRETAAGCKHDVTEEMSVWWNHSCSVNISISTDGYVRSMQNDHSKANPLRVAWLDGQYPTPTSVLDGCAVNAAGLLECSFELEQRAVFSELPTPESLLERLKIGAFPPQIPCTDCSGLVKSYASSDAIDAETVFEYQGRFFRNIEVLVHVGGQFSFRNPPAFMLMGTPAERDALAEVEALLDHLSEHPNTAPFISRLLIQRFVTSSPSAAYVGAVAEAFATGSYNGEMFSGKYGDLGATIAAVLQHPEARGGSTSPSTGKLREPVIKLIHLMRSMEYVDKAGREVVLQDIRATWRGMSIRDTIGQWPYYAPRVFNFYTHDYKPTEFADGVFAPEFEIFTPPFLIGWLNGVLDLVEDGLSWCDSGFGMDVPMCDEDDFNTYNGELTWNRSFGSPEEELEELNVLLTGGRLGPSKAAVHGAYDQAEEGKKLKAAQKAIMMSPEFHTLGDISAVGTRQESPTGTGSQGGGHSDDDYKAFIMVFLRGGADTFNMLVPLACDLTEEYLQVRTSVSIDPNTLIPISAEGQVCDSFGLHHDLPFLKTLYDDGELAFASNVGNLVEPITMEQLREGGGRQCRGLFSHADQVLSTQSLLCQAASAAAGFGGLMGDVLSGKGYNTQSFSIAGQSLWSIGYHTPPVVIHDTEGAVYYTRYEEDQALLWNVSQNVLDNIYAEAFNQKQWGGIQTMDNLRQVLDNATLTASFDQEAYLSRQFYQVARAIETRKERGVQRDFFYVELDGFDHHEDSELAGLSSLYRELNNALESFVSEMKAQGVFDHVVVASGTDFARTLTSNGQGTDHAWAGNNFVIGGSVHGGKIHNEYPTSLREGSDQDLGRGRLLPKYPLENVYAPIAEWMGLDAHELTTPFRNLHNFDRDQFILPRSTLFQD